MKALLQTLLLSTCLLFTSLAAAEGEWVGQPVPAFRLQDQNDQWHAPQDYRGRWLVVYFYPKDGTPGCTEEAKNFRDSFPVFQKRNIALLGVSLDDVDSHKAFAAKHKLPFPILADGNHAVAKSFKVLRGFGPIAYARRETFLIDPKGTIVYHYASVDTGSHAEQVLKDIANLSQKP